MKQLIWLTVFLIISVLGSGAVDAASHSRDAPHASDCLLDFHVHEFFACYAPNHARQAEVSFPRPTISPIALVIGATHLPLLQVIVTGPKAGVRDGIDYIFERVRRDLGDIPGMFRKGDPQFVVVTEFAFNYGSPHRSFGRYRQAPNTCTNWQYDAGVTKRHLELLVTSNLPPRQVRRLATDLMAEGAASFGK